MVVGFKLSALNNRNKIRKIAMTHHQFVGMHHDNCDQAGCRSGGYIALEFPLLGSAGGAVGSSRVVLAK